MCAMETDDNTKSNNTSQCDLDDAQPSVVVKALVDGAHRRARVRTFQELVEYCARIFKGLPFSRIDVTYTDDDGDVIHVVEECEFDEAIRVIATTPKPLLSVQLKRDEEPPILTTTTPSTESRPEGGESQPAPAEPAAKDGGSSAPQPSPAEPAPPAHVPVPVIRRPKGLFGYGKPYVVYV